MELEHQWQEMPVSIAFDQVGGDRLLRTSALFAILQNGSSTRWSQAPPYSAQPICVGCC